MNRPTVLLVEDDTQLRQALAETLTLADYDVVTAADGSGALDVMATTPVAAVVTDWQMQPMNGCQLLQRIRDSRPDLPVLLMTAFGTVEHAVEAIHAGASDYIVKPFDAEALSMKLRRMLPEPPADDDFVAIDPVTRELIGLLARVAETDATVLLAGESGVGKEVFARYLHDKSARADGPFVAINCAAIPENMLEAILFGHEKGAFTGATSSRPGKFEQAQNGTLLLDEISEMPLELQAKLLRVLQEREVERIGAQAPIRLDVRIIATTNRDLRAQVAAGRFREDLYYRLSVFPMEVPPLRDRPGDILPLAELFLAMACAGKRPVPVLTDPARERLLAYSYPGNVRELQNLVQRALILSRGPSIEDSDLRFESGPVSVPAARQSAGNEPDGLQAGVMQAEGQLIIDALRGAGGNRSVAAEQLGISPRTLRYKLARLRDAGYTVPAA